MQINDVIFDSLGYGEGDEFTSFEVIVDLSWQDDIDEGFTFYEFILDVCLISVRLYTYKTYWTVPSWVTPAVPILWHFTLLPRDFTSLLIWR